MSEIWWSQEQVDSIGNLILSDNLISRFAFLKDDVITITEGIPWFDASISVADDLCHYSILTELKVSELSVRIANLDRFLRGQKLLNNTKIKDIYPYSNLKRKEVIKEISFLKSVKTKLNV